MKDTLTTSQAADRLRNDENSGFSYMGAKALVEYLEDIELETGNEIEFDVVAIRCEYSEYGTAIEAAKDFGFEPEDEDEDEDEESALSWLENRTTVIPFNGGLIVQAF